MTMHCAGPTAIALNVTAFKPVWMAVFIAASLP